jgi:hypothetical protein
MMSRVLPVVCLLIASSGLYAQRGGGGGGRGGGPNPPDPTGQGQGAQGQNGPGQNGQGGRGNQNGQGQTGAAGTAAADLPPGTVEGRVISTTGEPVRKASLTLRPNGRGGGSFATTSANDGSFKFASVDEGTYSLSGERAGFVSDTYSTNGGDTAVITVVSNQATTGIQFKLIPQSVILGHVYDEDGDPVQGANVQVQRYSYPRGVRQLTQTQNGTSNDVGEFRIANLPPGRYYLSATNPRRAQGQGGGRGGRNGRGNRSGGRGGPAQEAIEDYVLTYYPNALEVIGATPLDLIAGSEMRGIDVRLLKSRFYRITGSVSGVPAALAPPADNGKGDNGKGKAKQFAGGARASAVMLNLIPRSAGGGRGGQIGGTTMDPNTGTFEFPAVSPGAYYVIAQSQGPAQQRVTARVPVDVGNGDVTGIPVRLAPPLTLKGSITVEGTQPSVSYTSLRLSFVTSQPGAGGGQNGQAQVNADGTFQTQLDADSYTLDVSGVPDGYYLKSVRLSGRDMPDAALDLSLGAGQMELVLASNAGSVTGQVQNARNEPAASVTVTLVPASGSLRRDLNKKVTSDAGGSFTFSGLPPGDYKLYAWEEVETNAWMDREFRQPFESQSVSVKVDQSATPNVTVRLIDRSQVLGSASRRR